MSSPIYDRHVSSPLWLQTVPRNQGRADVPAIALNDAGHGTGGATINPILYGMGMTLNFEFNAFVRTFQVFVEIDGVSEEITGQLERVITTDTTAGASQRYRVSGSAGTFPLGLSTSVEADFTTAKEILFTVQMSNITIARESVSSLLVTSANDMRHCPDAEDCDFELFGHLNKAGLRIFENMVEREAAENVPVSFFFDQLDQIVAAAPDAIALLTNYNAGSTVGVEFTNDGENCGPVISGATPSCGSKSCCCQIDGRNPNYASGGGGTAALASPTIVVDVTFPTIGSSSCVGWQALEITFPGADTTGGFFEFDDTTAIQLFSGGVPVATSASSGLGNLNSRTVVASTPIACGEDLRIVFQMIAAQLSGTARTLGQLSFADSGACNPEDVGIALPAYSATPGGGDPKVDPPANVPLQQVDADPQNALMLPSYTVTLS